MSLPLLLDAFDRSAAGRDLVARLPGRGASLDIGGLPGSSGAVLAAALVRSSPQRLLAVVAPTPADAERWFSDLQFLSDEAVALYPQREALGEDEPHYEIAGERVETIEALLGGRLRIVVTTARAIAERTLVPASLEKRRLRLAKGTRIRPKVLVDDLEAMGFRRVTTVTEVAEFSARGDSDVAAERLTTARNPRRPRRQSRTEMPQTPSESPREAPRRGSTPRVDEFEVTAAARRQRVPAAVIRVAGERKGRN